MTGEGRESDRIGEQNRLLPTHETVKYTIRELVFSVVAS